jgi:hypothetical protein
MYLFKQGQGEAKYDVLGHVEAKHDVFFLLKSIQNNCCNAPLFVSANSL